MKYLVLFLAMAVILTSCEVTPPVDEGLTNDVHNIVPDDILDKFKELGIAINGGYFPPNIEGTYSISPLVLVKSNFADDISPGNKFDDMIITFSNQNNAKQTIICDYDQGAQIGNGLGSFITGFGNKFSVFTEVSGTFDGEPFKSVDIYSGEITSSGIKNFHQAGIVTLEASGTIKRGQGRLVYDSDGFSERVSKTSMSVNRVQNEGNTPSDVFLRGIYSK